MDQNIHLRMAEPVRAFRLPRYEMLPDMGLYLEQVTKYLNDSLSPLAGISITGSMISNYVKKGLVPNPVKKQYGRDQIGWLMYIALMKCVLSIDDIKLMLSIQRGTYPTQVAYDYFCCEMENMLAYVFGLKESPDEIGVESTAEKVMLRNSIIAVSHKIYLNALIEVLQNEKE